VSIQPRIVAVPAWGSNGNTRVVRVRVMNDRIAAPDQLAEMAHKFFLHELNLHTSLAGYLVRDGLLADGSRFRIVSNSGLHTLMLWPAGGELPPDDLAMWFRAIPTSDTLLNGDGGNGSRAWKVPGKPTIWPDALKPSTDTTKHPGHVTWCNPDLKIDRKPIVLAWHGPRSRYAATTGLDGQTGGAIVAHEKNPYTFPTDSPLAAQVLKDTGFVWINGHKLTTGISKVIAACFYEFDPVDHPKKYVLRVCTDLVGTARKLEVRDLVVADGDLGNTLAAFAKAKTALVTKATYTSSANKATANVGSGTQPAGDWDYWQRPHFNKSGTRLATIIIQVGSNGTDREQRAVSFNFASAWAIDDNHVMSEVVVSFTSDLTVTSAPWHITLVNTRDSMLACDFDGDTFVYVKLHDAMSFVQSGQNNGNIGSAGTGTKDYDEQHTWTVVHSTMGVLTTIEWRHQYHIDYNQHSAGGGNTRWQGSLTQTLTNVRRNAVDGLDAPPPPLAFFGDLSKASFAVGYWPSGTTPGTGTSHYSASGSVDVTQSSGLSGPAIPVSGSGVRGRMKFDVWLNGVNVLVAGTGGFTNTADAANSGSYNVFMKPADGSPSDAGYPTTDNNPQLTKYGTAIVGGLSAPPSYEGFFNTLSPFNRSTVYVQNGFAPVFQHSAVHPLRKCAYFGAAFFEDAYTTSSVVCGLELTAFDADVVIHNPPVYITGAHPTMSVPVFMGPALTSHPK
jgi:hypothetical protein